MLTMTNVNGMGHSEWASPFADLCPIGLHMELDAFADVQRCCFSCKTQEALAQCCCPGGLAVSVSISDHPCMAEQLACQNLPRVER